MTLVLAFSGLNLVVILVAMLKAGGYLKEITTATSEILLLRTRSDEHTRLIAGAMAQLNDLERRVGHLESA